jgi:hypothetical protein
MRNRRKLEFDKDEEDFTPQVLLNSLSETPESLTFDSLHERKSQKKMKTSNEIKNFQITYNEKSMH